MPEMDGLEALKEIIKIDSSAKVVICSAMGQQGMVLDAIKGGKRLYCKAIPSRSCN